MLYTSVDHTDDSIKHFCGVAGIYSKRKKNLPSTMFFPLFSLQHRGQESAGIAYRKPDKTVVYKDLGMVSSVLSHYLESDHPTNLCIGHVRYSTHGGNKLENSQPISVKCNKGEIALAHNGNISNTQKIKGRLFDEGSIFQTSSDTELILHLISRSRENSFFEALYASLQEIEGAYSMVLLHDDSLMAVRDPRGFRPLYIGQKDDIYVCASETCALDILKIREYREVEPGEIITINERGLKSDFLPSRGSISQCVFELIYFARPDSQVFKRSVYQKRKLMGRALAASDKKSGSLIGDIVVPVPDSGTIAALGYAEEAGLPFDLGLTRNHYAGRSFILPSTPERELAVRMKLHPVVESIKGKRVILIDDSLVRGTTSKILVNLLKDSGAKEVHLRLSSPELKWPCFFGIDIPTRKELISNHLCPEEIAVETGADSVRFLTINELKLCLEEPEHYCYACFSGRYTCPVHFEKRDLLENDYAQDPAVMEFVNEHT